MPERQQWILTVDPACSLDHVCEELVRHGYALAAVLREIGVIVVEGHSGSKNELSALNGVVSVEPDSSINIGPPGDPSTW